MMKINSFFFVALLVINVHAKNKQPSLIDTHSNTWHKSIVETAPLKSSNNSPNTKKILQKIKPKHLLMGGGALLGASIVLQQIAQKYFFTQALNSKVHTEPLFISLPAFATTDITNPFFNSTSKEGSFQDNEMLCLFEPGYEFGGAFKEDSDSTKTKKLAKKLREESTQLTVEWSKIFLTVCYPYEMYRPNPESLLYSNFGQSVDALIIIKRLNTAFDLECKHFFLLGHSRGGAAMLWAIYMLQHYAQYQSWLHQAGIADKERADNILARIEKLHLANPWLDTDHPFQNLSEIFLPSKIVPLGKLGIKTFLTTTTLYSMFRKQTSEILKSITESNRKFTITVDFATYDEVVGNNLDKAIEEMCLTYNSSRKQYNKNNKENVDKKLKITCNIDKNNNHNEFETTDFINIVIDTLWRNCNV